MFVAFNNDLILYQFMALYINYCHEKNKPMRVNMKRKLGRNSTHLN